MRIAVLASGRGSNLQAILAAIASLRLNVRVVGVFSDRPRAGALDVARQANVPGLALRPADHATREAFDESLFSHVAAVHPDLIVCAGYMRLLGAAQVDAWSGRMINIHPSLLPAFKGLRTHEHALAARVSEHGASVHFVTCELDGGPVIAQARVPVLHDDDVPTLAARVLAREHPLLVGTLRLFAGARVALRDDGVHLDGRRLLAPLQLDSDPRWEAA